jgi:hypothetical protein
MLKRAATKKNCFSSKALKPTGHLKIYSTFTTYERKNMKIVVFTENGDVPRKLPIFLRLRCYSAYGLNFLAP